MECQLTLSGLIERGEVEGNGARDVTFKFHQADGLARSDSLGLEFAGPVIGGAELACR